MNDPDAPTPLTRRRFLAAATALGGGAFLGCAPGTDGAVAPKAGPLPATGPGPTASAVPAGTLVLVDLDGGNDGLNTVVPVDDDDYRSLRGALALDPSATHPLSEGFALHPSLTGCKALWDAGRLAVVHGVGFAELDRSHFHCRDMWQAGGVADLSTGWVGRWLDGNGADVLDAVAVDRILPLLVRGHRRSGAVVPPGPFDLPDAERLAPILRTLSVPDTSRAELEAAVAASTGDLLELVATLGPVLAERSDPTRGEGDTTGDGDGLGDQLATVAHLIAADLPTRVYAAKLRGFDTHAAQAGTHAALLTQVDEALSAFFDGVGDRDVTVVLWSEFGRRVAPNSSGGTDHGKAGTVLVAGNVRPGHHGDPPPLDRLDDGDLATTTDFRSVLGGLAEGVLTIPAPDLFGPGFAPLDLV